MSNAEIPEDVLSKIKKLLTLSGSSNPNEAAVALAKASELMAKHNIDRAVIDWNDSGKKNSEPIIYELFDVPSERNKINWKINLASSIIRFFDCTIITETNSNNIMFLGRESDLNAARYLYRALCNVIEDFAAREWESASLMTTVHGKTWKASFRDGMIITIEQRLQEQKRAMMTAYQSNSRALVVVDEKKLEIQQYVSQHFGRLGTRAAVHNAKSSAAFKAGKEAGKRVNLGGNSASIGRTRRLGNK